MNHEKVSRLQMRMFAPQSPTAVACGKPPATSPGESCGFQPGAAGTFANAKVSGALQEPLSQPLPKDEEFLVAPMEIACKDEWPPFRLTQRIMRAYKTAEDEGLIRIEAVQISKSTASAAVAYRSTIPVEWIRQRLKKAIQEDET